MLRASCSRSMATAVEARGPIGPPSHHGVDPLLVVKLVHNSTNCFLDLARLLLWLRLAPEPRSGCVVVHSQPADGRAPRLSGHPAQPGFWAGVTGGGAQSLGMMPWLLGAVIPVS